MGKYALFASYTDAGLGWNGFQATSDRVDDLKRLMTPDRGRFFTVATTRANADDYCNWWQIVDLEKLEIIEQGTGDDLPKEAKNG